MEIMKECTFTPKISNKNNSKISSPIAHAEKLYKEVFRKENKGNNEFYLNEQMILNDTFTPKINKM